jgi:hypothetical protein
MQLHFFSNFSSQNQNFDEKTKMSLDFFPSLFDTFLLSFNLNQPPQASPPSPLLSRLFPHATIIMVNHHCF